MSFLNQSSQQRPRSPAASTTTNSRRYSARYRQEQENSISDVIRQYDDRERIYNITIPRQQFQLGGYQLHDPNVPRGRNGIDTMERDMREVRAMQNEEALRNQKLRQLDRTFDHRSALEDQMNEKTRYLEQTRNMELEEDLENLERNRPYGPYHDEREELEWKKRQQSRQKDFLEKQISEKAMRDAEEAQHFAAPVPDWEEGFKELDGRIHRAIHGDPSLIAAQQNEDNQPKVIQDARESTVRKKEEDTKPLSMNVAMFADRILLAEKAKKEGRERYKAELDAQCKERAAKRQSDIYNNIIIDRSYHFGALERAAPPTPDSNTSKQQLQNPHYSAASSSQNSNFAIRGVAGVNNSREFGNNSSSNTANKRLYADHYSATPQRGEGMRRFW